MGSTGARQAGISPIAELQNTNPKPSRRATDIWNAGFAEARQQIQNNRDEYMFSFGRGLSLPVLQNIQQNIIRQQERLNNNTTIPPEVKNERQRILNLLQRGLNRDYEDYWENRRGI